MKLKNFLNESALASKLEDICHEEDDPRGDFKTIGDVIDAAVKACKAAKATNCSIHVVEGNKVNVSGLDNIAKFFEKYRGISLDDGKLFVYPYEENGKVIFETFFE